MQLAAFPRLRLLPDIDYEAKMTVFPVATLAAKARERNAMIRRRFAIESPSHAPVAQWIEQPPPKGQVGRSIRLWGAKILKKSYSGSRHALHPRARCPVWLHRDNGRRRTHRH